MWLLEFLFGMFLAYLLMSPRLRHFLFHRNHTPNIQTRIEAEEKRERKVAPPNILLRNGHEVEVDDDSEIQKWLNKNPELEKLNRKVKAKILS